MGKMGGQWRWGHKAASLRCQDPIGESSLASQICELNVRLALICLRFFLLRALVDEVPPFTLLVLRG